MVTVPIDILDTRHPLPVVCENVERPNMHRESTGLNRIPLFVLTARLSKDPQEETNCEVYIVLEMTDKITGANIVKN